MAIIMQYLGQCQGSVAVEIKGVERGGRSHPDGMRYNGCVGGSHRFCTVLFVEEKTFDLPGDENGANTPSGGALCGSICPQWFV